MAIKAIHGTRDRHWPASGLSPLTPNHHRIDDDMGCARIGRVIIITRAASAGQPPFRLTEMWGTLLTWFSHSGSCTWLLSATCNTITQDYGQTLTQHERRRLSRRWIPPGCLLSGFLLPGMWGIAVANRTWRHNSWRPPRGWVLGMTPCAAYTLPRRIHVQGSHKVRINRLPEEL